MEELTPPPTWRESARTGMGQTRRMSERVNLGAMAPRGDLSSTRYCLATPGEEYVILQPGNSGLFRVDLRDAPGNFAAEWLDVYGDRVVPAKPVRGGARLVFDTPFGGPAVLYLKAAGR